MYAIYAYIDPVSTTPIYANMAVSWSVWYHTYLLMLDQPTYADTLRPYSLWVPALRMRGVGSTLAGVVRPLLVSHHIEVV